MYLHDVSLSFQKKLAPGESAPLCFLNNTRSFRTQREPRTVRIGVFQRSRSLISLADTVPIRPVAAWTRVSPSRPGLALTQSLPAVARSPCPVLRRHGQPIYPQHIRQLRRMTSVYQVPISLQGDATRTSGSHGATVIVLTGKAFPSRQLSTQMWHTAHACRVLFLPARVPKRTICGRGLRAAARVRKCHRRLRIFRSLSSN